MPLWVAVVRSALARLRTVTRVLTAVQRRVWSLAESAAAGV